MIAALRKLAGLVTMAMLLAVASYPQTASLEGDVKGEDGQALRGALIKIERLDIKGNYKVKTDKKGHWFHAGLPLGTYKIILEVDGKDRDMVNGVRTRLGDPTPINFDLQAQKKRQEALQRAAESGTLTQEQAREMSPEQRAAMEKQVKERQAQLAKNKALNDAFNQGMEALKTKQYEAAVGAFQKAGELDPKQYVVWANLAEAYVGLGSTKTGAEQQAALDKSVESFTKALELKPDDAATHNNFALALAKGKKFDQAKEELAKAAQLDPPNAGKYFYNLGAVLVNTGQLEPAGDAFKKAIEADPNYADAQYQYGVYLISKAQTTADGKIIPPPGTREAFQKYLELRPDGAFADAAKGMLSTLDTSVQTVYKNPSAPPPSEKKSTSKKK
jgi:tetratricopeptide (TPR) repeat protein